MNHYEDKTNYISYFSMCMITDRGYISNISQYKLYTIVTCSNQFYCLLGNKTKRNTRSPPVLNSFQQTKSLNVSNLTARPVRLPVRLQAWQCKKLR